MRSPQTSGCPAIRIFYSKLSRTLVLTLATVITALVLAAPVFAAGLSDSVTRLDDGASLLSPSQRAELGDALDALSAELGFDVVFVSTDTIGWKTPSQYADDYYDQHGYGADGILLLVNMGERDIYFSTAGKCINIFTDYGIEYLVDDVGEFLTDGDYAGAVERFVDRCRVFAEEYENGEAFDVGHRLPPGAGRIAVYAFISVAVGLVVGLITAEVMRAKLRTVRPQPTASAYTRESSLNVTEARDVFLYSNVVRTARPKDSGSHGGGGSSTHVSSGGVTHGGGGGKF